jgi:putative membrane protein
MTMTGSRREWGCPSEREGSPFGRACQALSSRFLSCWLSSSPRLPSPPESEDSIGDISVAFESLTVRDWARLLVATQDPSFYRGKTFNAEGSIIKSTDPDVFLLTRFVVTCCAVDAAPVSVPVFLPGWQNDPLLEGWIRVSGEFHTAEQPGDWGALVLVPREIRQEEAPDAPYLF